MNAKEAREFSLKQKGKLDSENNIMVYDTILEALTKGETSVAYFDEIRPAVIETYRSEGYIIEIEQCGERNSGESCCELPPA